MNPIAVTFPIAAIVAMLFLLWRDFVRPGASRWWVLIIRTGLFLGVTGTLLFNRVRYARLFEEANTDFLVGLAVIIGVSGAGYYLFRGFRALRPAPPRSDIDEEPLPSIFGDSGQSANSEDDLESR